MPDDISGPNRFARDLFGPLPARYDRLAPLRPLRDLEAAVWSVCMARQYPTRYREVAAEVLGQVLAGPG